MKKAASFLVDKRHILLCLFLVLAAVSLALAGQVRINYDLTEYLPADSRMRRGILLMEQEFGQAESSGLRVMFRGLQEQEKEEIFTWLSALEQASLVEWDPGPDYNRGDHTLYEITAECGSHSKDAAALFDAVHRQYDGRGVVTGGSIHEANTPLLPPYIIIAAVGLVTVILLLMCSSWFEPVVFLANIGIAVAVNLGTNIVFPSVSEYTASIVGIMQLVLSMDYSIILLNRYTQEKAACPDRSSAMKAAIAASVPAVAGSSLTTFAGLMCLAFMRFRLGADMGFALAKSVIVSLVCIFTVLPSLILISDGLIEKTRKRPMRLPMGGYSRLAVRRRVGFAVLFAVLFAVSFVLKDRTEILYMLQANNAVDEVFEKRHTVVLLYEKQDSGSIAEVLAPFEEDENVIGITGYYNTIGKEYTPAEIAELFGGMSAMADEGTVSALFTLYAARMGDGEVRSVTLPDLIAFLRDYVAGNPLFGGLIDDGMRQQLAGAGDLIRENAARLEGDRYGRVMLTTVYPEDSARTRAFISSLSARCGALLSGESCLIGTSVMNEEMAQTFGGELRRITLLSAAAIFIVVALTFRSLTVPLILVLTVQCGIYLTMTFIGLSGSGMYYLALLIVQCILMGATIDYGILYTSYYRECRGRGDPAAAIDGAFKGALRTILTSALIMIVAAGILGFMFANPAIGEICLTISRGAISAALLIVFVLPGVLAALDRWVAPKGKGRK